MAAKKKTAAERKAAHPAAVEKAAEQPDSFEIWKCLDCKDAPEFSDFNTMKKHLHEVHGLDTSGKITGTKQMTMHIDGSNWYASQYKIVVKDVHLSCYVRNKRNRDTMMY